jgi:hypothetical protein
VVGEGEGDGVWWATACGGAKARACGGRRRTGTWGRGGERGRKVGKGERGKASKELTMGGGVQKRSSTINIEHVDVERLHVTLRLSASRDVST